MNWDNYFIDIAKVVAKKSRDPSSQVGCVIVDSERKPVSFGFNGFVAGCNEKYMTFERPLKYNLILHAEMNALIFSKRNLKDCIIYSTHGPCDNCLKHVVQAGITEFYYDDPGIMKKRGTLDQKDAIKRLICATGIIVENINNKVSYVKDLGFDQVYETYSL